MAIKCKLCTNTYGKGIIFSFHSFPKDPLLLEKWIEIVKKCLGPSYVYKSSHRLCSHHFKPDLFKFSMIEQNSKMLKENALPTLNLKYKLVETSTEFHAVAAPDVSFHSEIKVSEKNLLLLYERECFESVKVPV